LIPIADLQKFAKLKLNSAVVVVDEAYLEFANAQSATTLLKQLPNVIVLKTLSKAYALAGIRMGITIADKKIIQCLLKSLAPYPLASPCVDIVDTSLSANGMLYYQSKIANLIKQRTWLIKEFKKIKMIKKVFPSQTNFILLIVDDPSGAVNQLTKYNIIIKNKNKDVQGAIRISVGTDEQNKILIAALKNEPIENNIRTANLSRITKETEIYVETTLDGKGTGKINTGLGFFDHMLDQIKKHSQISLTVLARGDLEVDVHHLIEDTGILFGQCLKKALGNKVGIERYAANTLVMDEAKAEIAIDICDRPYFCFNGTLPKDRVGMFPSDLVKHFFDAIAKNLGATLNISVTGENTHHMIEIIFKCFAKVLKSAIAITSNQLMSTKGVI
jgi:histidinol-phosphate aminotransferase/imidazoleglycerol-phosphate dehydratase/histidinol-phosphatase